jgi:hypothetical protein
MKLLRFENRLTPWLTRLAFPIAMLGALLAFDAVLMGQHFAGGHSGGFSGSHGSGFSGAHGSGFSGAHASGFSGGGFHGGFSAPGSFRGSPRPAPRPYGPAPRVNWNAPRLTFAPQRPTFPGYRPAYGAWNRDENREGDHRGRDRGGDRIFLYSGYPYLYANSWELLPWDLGYPDFTGYGGDDDNSRPAYTQAEPSGDEQQEPPEGPYQPDYPRAPYESPTNQAAVPSPPHNEPELVLIFKDGHTQNIRNYVLTPGDVIVMDDAASGRTPRIPLSDLNLPATQKAAEQAGLEFSPPSA